MLRLGAVALAVLVVAACAETRDPLAGVYLVKGGGAPLEAFNALSASFTAQHPGVKFEFEDVGSKPGMTLVANGAVDLATSSSEPDAVLRERITLVSIGVTGTAMATGVANRVNGLTREQVRKIYTGEITDWSAVGGQPGKIIVSNRSLNSAIRGNFESFFFPGGKPTYVKDMFELNDTSQTVNALTGRSDVIGILTINSYTLGEPSIKLLAIDGVTPTKQNLQSGAYPVRRALYIAYNPGTAKPAIRSFVDFVRGPEGQKIVNDRGAG